ncbi:hypothetical protein [Clostridium polynesiense]|uniref:hypothetical protein n=1 Tax=Clostridium polynesiense TaxID=1325933 RepID=UPI000694F17F|nr:hypothetical protein [Clostridium polynesiense]
MKITTGEKIVYSILLLSLIMVNPPILNYVNNYAVDNPIMFNRPTMYLWLQLWYFIAIIAFLIGAVTIKRWKKDY